MKCKISCSFGEVIDKKTILSIKLKKIKDKEALKNISLELETIKKDIPLVNTEDILFKELYDINSKLWILEDLIREKSNRKEFDSDYIKYAEEIHKTNDQRYLVKHSINIKYKSELKEEKSYTNNRIDNNDINLLEKGKRLYTNGKYQESYRIISEIMEKYKHYNKYDSFFIDLLFSYENITNIFNYENKYYNKIKNIIDNINNLNISYEQLIFIKTHYSSYCLSYKDYKHAYTFINMINHITGPNINYSNMSFFKDRDINKTLLVYDGGGIGDKIMFSRFIPLLCDKYKYNSIMFLLEDNLIYLFKQAFKNINNLKLVTTANVFNNFDYHCSLLTLIKYMNIDYNNLFFTPLFMNINYKCLDLHTKIINTIKHSKKKTYVINWKGNPKNPHELYNRRMELKNAIPLFKLSHINWIVITKDLTINEKKILNEYNVDYYGDLLDTGPNCFEDTISILKNVEGLISTDTSLVHLSANLNIKTFVLLTLGCEWRWTKNDEKTLWYPNSILLRQNKLNNWDNVIEKIKELI